MSYQVWSVVFGEQPTAAKWNILGQNDAGFNDGTAIGDDAIIQRHIADNIILPAQLTSAASWWSEVGRTTLGSAGDLITVSGLSAYKYLLIIMDAVASGGTLDTNFKINNDSGANYAQKHAVNYGAAVDTASASSIALESSTAISGGSEQIVMYIFNPSGADKVIQWRAVQQDAGLTAASVPRVLEGVGTYNSNTQLSRVDWTNSGGGGFPIGTEVIVLGHN
jgi:hypothetical protein